MTLFNPMLINYISKENITSEKKTQTHMKVVFVAIATYPPGASHRASNLFAILLFDMKMLYFKQNFL